MAKNPVHEFILDRLAGGSSFKELTREYHLSRTDFINAALFGLTELREEYIGLLAKKYKK